MDGTARNSDTRGTASDPFPPLADTFARALPELSVEWRATEFPHPQILALNAPLARELGLGVEWLRSDQGARFLTGNEVAPGSRPVAQAYAGHQFGAYVPRLGDGRALLLGEIDTAGGARDLHLKGSGRTPFARGADGFAAVGPMLREYLMGEAMHALGIPTTRALAVVATGGRVLREESFDPLPGAVLARVASSHLRVGTFQYARSLADPELLERLTRFAVDRHLPGAAGGEQPALRLLEHTIAAQARTVAAWMLAGFVHGVMNTDNTTISGETIDYGPCAFLDAFDPAAAFSSIDHLGRYAYGAQPGIVLWNLTRLAETLLPLLADDEEEAKRVALAALDGFAAAYDGAWIAGMRAKLGFADDQGSDDRVRALAAAFLDELHQHRIDYTSAFRALGDAARGREDALRALYPAGEPPGTWLGEWRELSPDGAVMDTANPVYIPRNHLVDEALELASDGDLTAFDRLLGAVLRPYEERAGLERYALPAPSGGPRHVTYCGT